MRSYTQYGVVFFVILVIGASYVFFHRASDFETFAVTESDVVEEVVASGKVEASTVTELRFKTSGTLEALSVAVGDLVMEGTPLAKQNTGHLDAQVQEMEAGIEVARARLAQMKAGATSEDRALADILLANAQHDRERTEALQNTLVGNAYTNLLNATPEAIPEDGSSDDDAPEISGTYLLEREGDITISSYYSSGGVTFTVSGLTSGRATGDSITPQPIGTSGLYITFPDGEKIDEKEWIISIPNKKASNYLTLLNAYEQALKNRDDVLTTADALIAQRSAERERTLGAVRIEDVAVYEAQIRQAEAQLQKTLALRDDAYLLAPTSGIITKTQGAIGEVVGPDTSVITLMPKENLHITLNILEDTIVGVREKQKGRVVLDALPHEAFSGVVAQVNPAETIIGGAVYYETTISLDTSDERVKSGMTATVWIETNHSQGAHVVPASALVQRGSETFVSVLENGKLNDREVITGLLSRDGMVEIVSGLAVGEVVALDSNLSYDKN